MRSRPAYTECRLYYHARRVAVGDVLVTPGGSAYLVTEARQGRRPGRWNLRCLRWPVDEVPDDAQVLPLYWFPRRAGAATTLAARRRGAAEPSA